jgi:hypothetical protein
VRRAPTVADARFGRRLRHLRGAVTPVLAVTAVVTFTAIADHLIAVTGDLRRDPW